MNTCVTISAEKSLTPNYDAWQELCEEMANRVEDKIQRQFEENPVKMFGKFVLCLLSCCIILLGKDDEDVKKLQGFAADKKVQKAIEKEILADDDKIVRRLSLS